MRRHIPMSGIRGKIKGEWEGGSERWAFISHLPEVLPERLHPVHDDEH